MRLSPTPAILATLVACGGGGKASSVTWGDAGVSYDATTVGSSHPVASTSTSSGQSMASEGVDGGTDARANDAAKDAPTDAVTQLREAAVCSPIPPPTPGTGASFDASLPPPMDRLLFIGNSFTYTNDLPGTVVSLVERWAVSASPPYVNSFASGGSTLAEDVTGIQEAGAATGLGLLLGVGDAGSVRWNDVMLQEQSEIPGFWLSDPERQASMAAVVTLAKNVVAAHATPVLVMTWGYLSGDPENPAIYPDFLSMESLLETGYRQMAFAVARAGYPVRVAPVGPAFQAVYFLDQAAGRVPTAVGSVFYSLFGTDGKHPAPPGTYLAALVVASTLYGVDPGSLCANPDGLTPAVVGALREAARTAVVTSSGYADAGAFDAAAL